MKKTIKISGLIFIAVLLISTRTMGQAKIELSPFAGYMFGGSVDFYEGKLKANNGVNYGIAMDVKLANETQIELMWTQLGTDAQFEPYYGFQNLGTNQFDVNIGYIQIGGVREMDLGNNVNPFGVFTLGTTYFIPKNVEFADTSIEDINSEWVFSMTMGAGAKIWFSDRVGIRLQGNLMLPMFWGGAGFTVGTGGSGFYVGGGTSMVQGSFTGGLIFALGD